MSADTGGAAFPGPQAKVVIPPNLGLYVHDIQVQHNGMTLLDYFAGRALGEMLHLHCDGARDWGGAQRRAVSDAYDVAAAMLTERARRMEEKP